MKFPKYLNCAGKPFSEMGLRWTSWGSSYIYQLIVPWGWGFDFECFIFKYIVVIIFLSISITMTIMWMMQYPINEKTTLVQVMAWCHQATSHFLSQHWSITMSLHGATSPQWVKLEFSHPNYNVKHFIICQAITLRAKSTNNWNWFMMWLLAKKRIESIDCGVLSYSLVRGYSTTVNLLSPGRCKKLKCVSNIKW